MYKLKSVNLFKYVLPYFIIFGSLSFTIITTLVGYQYEEGARIYVIYNVLVSLLGYAYYAWYFISNNFISNKSISLKRLGVIIGIVLLIFAYGFTVVTGNCSPMASDFFKYMLVWSVPACLYGLTFFENNNLAKLWKIADAFMLLITAVVCINGMFYYLNGRDTTSVSGTTTYQTMSYLSALAIGLNYYLLINKDNQYRPSFFQKSRFYKIICIILLPVQTLSLVLTGGRGGMILTVVYFFTITLINNRSINKTLKRVVIVLSIIGLIILLSSNNEMIVEGLGRIFEFLGTDGGINWDGTSGRDKIYIEAIDLIKIRPVIGYGVWGLFEHIQNPHNIFLEWLLGGGILGLLIGIIILVLAIKKYIIVQRKNPQIALILIFFLYNFVMLMFSGTYLCAPTLWFFLSAMLGSNTKSIETKAIS